ncbi:hypothetical protein NA56DRAFT_756767 [Hyaloscypha hepaticicola]|uniref:NACHT domain-containing protein n=1 Tax=Hyaloscypha hepaticicola TaxID=2082293 RepID=A0A2J6PDV0_9HELO|nr:hypothetical protein NA56DRAFT_756767 [Hyaloscypha hepaticicola]
MASNQPQLGLFSLYLQSFVETLTDEQKNEFEFSTLEDFQAAIVAIQNRQNSVRKMRNLARLRCFLEAMDQYGKVIEVFVNASELVCFIWGPAKFLLQTASAYTEAFDALLDAYQQIGESLPLLSQYQALFQRNPSMRKVLALIYSDILEFHKKALKYFRQRTWRQLFNATWKTFRTEFSGLLVNIQRHGRLVESQANLVEFEQLFHQMEMGRVAAKADFQRRKEEEERNRRIAVRNWLSAASTDVDQERGVSVRKHNPGSGRWLLGNNQVQGWFNPEFCSAPVVWINGIPGAGKTVLASLMVEELQQLRATHPITLGFFYCKHKDSQRNTFNAVARAILAQLLNQNEDLLPYLFEKASTSGEMVLESPSLTKELLETALKSSEKVYIVIDGLDECDSHEKKAIIQWFQSVIASLPDTEFDSMRCLFISQDDGEVGKVLSKIPAIRIRPEDTRADIQTYTTIWSKKIQEKFALPDEKREAIIAGVIERADGMFLFAKLVMENLFSQTKRENLSKELEPARFPRGLEDAYARIVDRILGDPSTKEDAKRLLGWLVCARRPLKWREIQCAVSINLDAKDIDLAERQLRVGSKILCGSLVEQRSDGSVEMVHLTARFFLVSQKHIDLASEEFELVKLCLGYLNFRCFQDSTPELETKEFVLKGYYSFLDYAALHWVDHLEEWVPTGSHTGSVNSVEDLIQEFLQNFWWKSERRTAIPSGVRTKFSRFKSCEFFNQLTKAAFAWKKLQKAYGADCVDSESVELVERICKVRKAIEKTLASSKGNDVLERNLVTFYGPELFKCPRISCKHFTDGFSTEEARDQHFQKHKWSFTCTYPGCPFGTLGFNSITDLNRHFTNSHEARQYGETQFPITQDPGDIDIKRAIRAGSTREVEKWLEQFNGAPKNAAISKLQQSAILAAVNQGDIVIFGLLLDGMPNISTTQISHLFNSALAKGQVTIANIVLNHPLANPFDCSGTYESPITTAIQLGRIEILKRIGEDGDVDWNNRIQTKSPGSRGRRRPWTTPLLLAAASGNLEVVKLLFKKEGVDLNFKDSNSRTPLWLATEKEQFEVVKLFVEKEGVDIDSKDSNSRTPLSWAAGNGYLDVTKLLLEKEGVNMDSQDSKGRTPLSWAAGNGHLEASDTAIMGRREWVPRDREDI